MKLYEIAHARTGDKGNISTISVIAYKEADYPLLLEQVTEERVQNLFQKIGATKVERYPLPNLGALNFVLHNTLGGGVTRSLALDAHSWDISWRIQKGSRIRLDVTSSDFPQYAAHPNSKALWSTVKEVQIAHQQIDCSASSIYFPGGK